MTPKGQKQGGILNYLKALGVELGTIVLAVVLFFLLPILFFLISSSFGILRYFLHKSAKCFRPDLAKMVTVTGSVVACDDLYTGPKSSVLMQINLEGTIDPKQFKALVIQNVLKGKFLNGEIKYPELKQYLTSWMGYFFWKNDKTFDLDRHLIVHNPKGPSTSPEELQDMFEKLVYKPWTRKRPLWEIILVPYCHPKDRDVSIPHSTVFMRYHHTLSDGYSMLKLITEGLTDLKAIPPNANPTYSTRNCLRSLGFWLAFPFLSSYEFAEILIKRFFKAPFKPYKEDESGKLHVGLTDKISIHRIKDIKDHFKVSFASVLMAVITGAVRDLLIIQGISVPPVLRSGTVLPLPGHPDKLRNYMGVGFLNLPTGESDPLKRLQLSSKDYERLKRSTFALLSKYLPMLGGVLPHWMMKPVVQDAMITCGITNFPAGYMTMMCQGCKAVDVFVGAAPGPLGLNFCAISYVDGLRISSSANVTVMSSKELKELVQLLEKHLDILHGLIVHDA